MNQIQDKNRPLFRFFYSDAKTATLTYTLGTLQDYGYIGRGIMEVTLEMGCEKTVREAQTGVLYGRNKNAFLYFLTRL